MTNQWDSRNECTLYDDGSISGDATAFELIEHCSWDPRATEGDYLESALLAVADELSVVADSLESKHQEVEFRIVFRAASRLRVALEVSRRHTEAEATEDPDPPVKQLYFCPLDAEGRFDFAHMEFATESKLAELGWVRRENVSKAVGILLGERTEVENAVPEVSP